MAQQAYASSQLHQAFYDYLINKFDGDTMEAQRSMETAERIIPVPVPGEYKMEEEKQTPAILADSHLLPKTQTTIFTEGEDDGTITKEQRRQNMMLREACLESFCFSGW